MNSHDTWIKAAELSEFLARRAEGFRAQHLALQQPAKALTEEHIAATAIELATMFRARAAAEPTVVQGWWRRARWWLAGVVAPKPTEVCWE